jgi:hypothetical protein
LILSRIHHRWNKAFPTNNKYFKIPIPLLDLIIFKQSMT